MKIENVLNKLIEKQLKIAFAESATGGFLSSSLTDYEGASKAFELGLVLYSNKMKETQLKIDENTIKTHGVISKEVSSLMALNIAKRASSEIGVGITGNAGLTALEKSILGEVWISIFYLDKIYSYHLKFKDQTRKEIKERSRDFIFEKLDQIIE